jgi:hypothetical protein
VDAPETVTEAVRSLQLEGYDAEFTLRGRAFQCGKCHHHHAPARLVIERTYRFEGPSDPADEAIVLGVACPDCGARGVIVSAYGPDADPEYLALLEHVPRP